MNAVVERARTEVDLKGIAETITRKHEEFLTSFRVTMELAIEIGNALQDVRSQLPRGEWDSWIEENLPFGNKDAKGYIRMACYPEISLGARNRHHARELLKGLPWANDPIRKFDYEEARRLVLDTGLSKAEAGRRLGVTAQAITYAVEDDIRERRIASTRSLHDARMKQKKLRAAERAAYEREQLNKLAKRVGGDISVAWVDVQRLMDLAGRLRHDESQNNNYRAAVASAFDSLGDAHQCFSRALKEAKC